MKTAEEIQEEYAISKGFECLFDLLFADHNAIDYHVENVQNMYAKLAFEQMESVKQLLVETAMRAQIMFPQTEEQDKWFESGTDAKTNDGKDFFLRLQKALAKLDYDKKI